MIVLDTNVVSELIRRSPDPSVVTWVDEQPAEELAITAVTVAELRLGVALLPQGRRRRAVSGDVERAIAVFPLSRTLPFDADAAAHYADLVAARTRLGRPIDALDAQIAAICRSRRARLATRNLRDFIETGVEVVDPWTNGAS